MMLSYKSIEIMKKEPSNIEEALSIAIKTEANEQSVLLQLGSECADTDEGRL